MVEDKNKLSKRASELKDRLAAKLQEINRPATDLRSGGGAGAGLGGGGSGGGAYGGGGGSGGGGYGGSSSGGYGGGWGAVDPHSVVVGDVVSLPTASTIARGVVVEVPTLSSEVTEFIKRIRLKMPVRGAMDKAGLALDDAKGECWRRRVCVCTGQWMQTATVCSAEPECAACWVAFSLQ